PDRALEVAWEARAAGDVGKAREYFVRAATQPGLEPAVLRGLGELDLAAGDARAAAPRLRKLVGEEPDDVQAHLALAQALKASGNASAARAEEVAASTLDPDVALALRGSTATETPLTLEGEKAPALPIAV